MRAWSSPRPLILVAPLDSAAAAEARELGIALIPLGTARDAFVENTKAVWNLKAKAFAPALIHAWHSRGFEQAWLLGARLGCPTTGTLHDHPRAFFHSQARRWLIRQAGRRFSGWVAVSQAVAEAGLQSGLLPRYRVIRNGLADGPLTPYPPQVIGFLGMNSKGKGFDHVARWIEATRDTDWRWNLYGQPAPEIAPAADELARRYPDRVRLMGRCPPADIYPELGVVVHASTEFESYGLVLAEAARAGLPVVAARIGGTPEVVVDEKTGYLFAPDRPEEGLVRLRQLLGDRALRVQMGTRARLHFETALRANEMFFQYAAFWDSIIEGVFAPCTYR